MMTAQEKDNRLEDIKLKLKDGEYGIFEAVIEARKIGFSFGSVADTEIDSWGDTVPQMDVS
jgi:hypothetical protein